MCEITHFPSAFCVEGEILLSSQRTKQKIMKDKIDQSNKGKSDKAHRLDYNPIMKCPIKGV